MWRFTAFGRSLLTFLDWCVSVSERLVVLSIGMAVAYVGYRLLFTGKQPADVLATLNLNWKALLVLLVPLLYQTIKSFLDEVEEAFGMKRRPKMEQQIIRGERS